MSAKSESTGSQTPAAVHDESVDHGNRKTSVLSWKTSHIGIIIGALLVLIVLGSVTIGLLSNERKQPLSSGAPGPVNLSGAASNPGGIDGSDRHNGAPEVTSEADCHWCDDLVEHLGANVGNGRTCPGNSNSNSNNHNSVQCTDLSAADFANGSYIMDIPSACYVLTEDIEFNPAEDNDFRATREPYKSNHAFVLGFFAAVVVQAPGVVFDLGGHEIRQSVAHRLQQRFFACIEVADRPFIKGQGPADFSGPSSETSVVPAGQFTLRNGRLGRSSHHGIHGNAAWNVLIEDVEIVDYEVAAISLNSVHDVILNRVHALGTSTHVPVIGTYSNARFLMPFVQRVLNAAGANASLASHVDRLQNASAELQQLMDQTFDDIVYGSRATVDPGTHPDAYKLFGNPSGLIDGNAYGFVFHSHGVAVNGFNCDRSIASTSELHHVLVRECKVENTRGKVHEVVALMERETSGVQRGPAGDVLRIEEVIASGNCSYAGHALANTQIALGALARAMGSRFGTLQIHPFIEDWALHGVGSLHDVVANGTFEYRRNGDTMFHTNKGVFGIRLDGGHHTAIIRTKVQTVENLGDAGHMTPLPGETIEDAHYTHGGDGGHPAQDPQLGYMGADTRGISLAAASSVLLDTVEIRGVYSRTMWSHGIDVFNDAINVHLHDVSIFNVSAFTEADLTIEGPKIPRAVGLRTATSAEMPTRSGELVIEDIKAGYIGLACNALHEASGIEGCQAPDINSYGMTEA